MNKYTCPITGVEVQRTYLDTSNKGRELLESRKKPADFNEYFARYGNVLIKKSYNIRAPVEDGGRDWKYIHSISTAEHRRPDPFKPEGSIFFENVNNQS